MKKSIIIFLLFICTFTICSCGKESTDTNLIDSQITSLINTSGETDLVFEEEDLENFEANELKDYTDMSTEEIYEDMLNDPDLMLDEEKLPKIEGFKFDIINEYEIPEEGFDDNKLVEKYLGEDWFPTYISCPRQAYGKYCSLYLTTLFPYGQGKEGYVDKSNLSERYLKLYEETSFLFGNPIFDSNGDVFDLSEIQEKGPISLMYKTSKYYLITLIEDDIENEMISVTYYFISTELPHSYNDEKPIIDFIQKNDSDFDISVYYETEEGNFVL